MLRSDVRQISREEKIDAAEFVEMARMLPDREKERFFFYAQERCADGGGDPGGRISPPRNPQRGSRERGSSPKSHRTKPDRSKN